MRVDARLVLGFWLTIDEVRVDVIVTGCEFRYFLCERVVITIAHAMDEPDRWVKRSACQGVQHAHHRRDTNAGADENNRSIRL